MDGEAEGQMGEVLNFRALLKLSPTNVWFLRLTKVIVALLAPTKEDTLCDVGCGAGQRVLLLAQYVKQAVGMDISPPVIDFLNQKTRRNNVSFHLVDATVEPPQEFVGAFHKCLCMDVLEHVEQPELVLNFINRITRPGGWSLAYQLMPTMKNISGTLPMRMSTD